MCITRKFFSAEAWAERDNLYRVSASQAAHLMCISEYHAAGCPQKLRHPARENDDRLDHSFARGLDQSRRTPAQGLARADGPAGTCFLFYPAHCWPHKNHRRLVEAFKMVEAELPADMQLVFTGRQFDEQHPARQLIEAENLRGRVVHLGYRSPLELRALYGGAQALVFPSLFEGFGLPIAEAIIADCPVACSAATSLPEIAGDAAIYFDANNTKDIARKLLAIATDEKLRANLLAAGRQRKPLFSSRLSAVKALSIYRRVFEEVYSP